uniref:Uncharacterized protein n=1 Tax=Chromera velia CCMP2878 TaxID=1169474 RepID=A0A0K6S7N9_9ALVE|eukprot:Cvel_21678.t1-p1 / transcript=Cvel_21678.t1 / gene=Cvel_21678 / organism=Chromera_velia_CCMP2878 / gene_product=Probable folate-biopterin transporter 6, putative / transcript_product=Probable folate-biopterin transporter 6, putative / location=Cvel_scaffold2054:9846-24502(-) / protein_length=1615 / sequence_SO=supercontig / SO=protein_coding / is_pseudo=false
MLVASTTLQVDLGADNLSQFYQCAVFRDGCEGLRVWESSVVLTRCLIEASELLEGQHVVEVGSGCGLVAVAAASLRKGPLECGGTVGGPASFTATDGHPEVMENLELNLEENDLDYSKMTLASVPQTLTQHGGKMQKMSSCPLFVCEAPWQDVGAGSLAHAVQAAVARSKSLGSGAVGEEKQKDAFDLLVGADLVYPGIDLGSLAEALAELLGSSQERGRRKTTGSSSSTAATAAAAGAAASCPEGVLETLPAGGGGGGALLGVLVFPSNRPGLRALKTALADWGIQVDTYQLSSEVRAALAASFREDSNAKPSPTGEPSPSDHSSAQKSAPCPIPGTNTKAQKSVFRKLLERDVPGLFHKTGIDSHHQTERCQCEEACGRVVEGDVVGPLTERGSRTERVPPDSCGGPAAVGGAGEFLVFDPRKGSSSSSSVPSASTSGGGRIFRRDVPPSSPTAFAFSMTSSFSPSARQSSIETVAKPPGDTETEREAEGSLAVSAVTAAGRGGMLSSGRFGSLRGSRKLKKVRTPECLALFPGPGPGSGMDGGGERCDDSTAASSFATGTSSFGMCCSCSHVLPSEGPSVLNHNPHTKTEQKLLNVNILTNAVWDDRGGDGKGKGVASSCFVKGPMVFNFNTTEGGKGGGERAGISSVSSVNESPVDSQTEGETTEVLITSLSPFFPFPPSTREEGNRQMGGEGGVPRRTCTCSCTRCGRICVGDGLPCVENDGGRDGEGCVGAPLILRRQEEGGVTELVPRQDTGSDQGFHVGRGSVKSETEGQDEEEEEEYDEEDEDERAEHDFVPAQSVQEALDLLRGSDGRGSDWPQRAFSEVLSEANWAVDDDEHLSFASAPATIAQVGCGLDPLPFPQGVVPPLASVLSSGSPTLSEPFGVSPVRVCEEKEDQEETGGESRQKRSEPASVLEQLLRGIERDEFEVWMKDASPRDYESIPIRETGVHAHGVDGAGDGGEGEQEKGCMQSFLDSISPWAIVHYVQRVSDNFGGKFVLLLLSVYFGCKGALSTFTNSTMLPYFKGMGLDGIAYQTNSMVAGAPWGMKGLIGALSDSLPLGGYNKKPYMLLVAVLGSAAVLVLAVTPPSHLAGVPAIVAVLFLFVNLEIATLDLLCEGKYAELMVEKPHTRSDIVTFVWLCVGIGGGLVNCVVGPLNDHYGATLVFWLCLPFACQAVVPVLLGWLPEKRVPAEKNNRFDTTKIKERKGLFLLAAVMAFGAIGLAAIGLVGIAWVNLLYSVGASAGLCVMGFFCLPPMLAQCNLYLFLQDSLYISIGGALDYWFTADAACVPGGPAFDYTYYNTFTALVGTAASGVGLWAFQSFMSDWRFRPVFWVSTIMKIGASLFDLAIVMRWNITVLGIDDKFFYLLGDAIVLPVCSMLNFMPAVVLTSKLCPKNMESTVYAILAGFANFGSSVAKAVGVWAIEAAGVKTKSPDCEFSSLPSLIVFCHCILPALSVPLTFLLIPDKRMSESILDPSEEAHGEGDGGGTKAGRSGKDAKAASETELVSMIGKPAGREAQVHGESNTVGVVSGDSDANTPSLSAMESGGGNWKMGGGVISSADRSDSISGRSLRGRGSPRSERKESSDQLDSSEKRPIGRERDINTGISP